MKYIKTYEDITNVDNDLPIDKTDKFKFKKDPRKFSWNQNRTTEEGVSLGKNNKWQVRVKDVNLGKIIVHSQYDNKKDAKKAYRDYYKYNKKEPKTIAKNDQTFKNLYKNKKQNKYPLEKDINPKQYKRKYNTKKQPKINDWVLVNIDINEIYKPSDKFIMFINFINNNIGQIIQRAESSSFFIEYQNIPREIKSYFNMRTHVFDKKYFEKFSSDKDTIINYLYSK